MDTDRQHDEANLSLLSSSLMSLNSSQHEAFAQTNSTASYEAKVVFPILFLATLFANVPVFVAVVCVHRGRATRRSPFDVLMLSVVIADLWLLVPLGFSSHAAVSDLTVMEYDGWCRFFCFLDFGLQLVIALHLLAVSLERVLSTKSSFRGDSTMTRKARKIVAACWIGVAVFSFSYAYVIPEIEYSSTEVSCIASVSKHAVYLSLRRMVFAHVFMILLCIVGMMVCTLKLMWTVWKYEHFRQLSYRGGQARTSPPPSPERGQDTELEQLVLHTPAPATPPNSSTTTTASGGPVTRSQTRNANSPVVGYPSSSSGGAATQSTSLSSRGRGRSPGHQPSRKSSQAQQVSPPSPQSPPRTPPGGGSGLQESERQQQPKRESHVIAWTALFFTMIASMASFTMQCFSNAGRYIDADVFGDSYAEVSRMMFYGVGLLNPIMYVLYYTSHFKTVAGCYCWYCNLLHLCADVLGWLKWRYLLRR